MVKVSLALLLILFVAGCSNIPGEFKNWNLPGIEKSKIFTSKSGHIVYHTFLIDNVAAVSEELEKTILSQGWKKAESLKDIHASFQNSFSGMTPSPFHILSSSSSGKVTDMERFYVKGSDTLYTQVSESSSEKAFNARVIVSIRK